MKPTSSLLSQSFRLSPSASPVRCGQLLAAALLATAALPLAPASAATVLWNWSGGDRNWSTAANWLGGLPSELNDVVFGNTDTQTGLTPVNTVDAGTSLRSLAYTNSSPSAYTSFQNTALASGQSLNVTNGLSVGVGSATGYTSDIYTYASLSGAGSTLKVVGGNVAVGQQSATSGTLFYLHSLLDMSALDNFAYLNTAGTFSIAGAGQRRAGGEVFLARSNTLVGSAVSLGIGAAGFLSNAGRLHLGATNLLFTDTLTVGRIASGNLLDFQTNLNNAMVKIRARDGVNGVANWYLGWNNQGNQSSSSASGTNDFTGGTLDATATNLYVGYFSAGTSTGARIAHGYFIVGTNGNNSLVVQNLFVGNVAFSTSAASSSSIGVFDVRGGNVSAGAVTLAQQLGSGLATGSLLLDHATMQVNGDLTDGGGTSTISASAATLTVAGRIGAPASVVETMNLSNATLGLTLVAPGDYTKAAASVGALSVDGDNGSTLLRINNANPAPGQYPLIAYTSLAGAAGFNGLSVQAPPGTTATLTNNTLTSPSSIDVVITASQLSWDGVPNGNWDIGTTANWRNGAVSVAYNETAGVGNRVLFDDTASGTTTVNLTTTLSPVGITVNNTNKDYIFGGTGKLSGAGGLIKQGPGTLTLNQAGVNDYAGSTYVGNGTLVLGAGGTAGMIGSGPLAVDGTVEFNRSDDLTLTNPVSGLGALNKLGADTLTLAGAVTYAGPTAIAGGTLQLSPAGTDTLPGNISGNGALVINGSGTVVLSGPANSYLGGTLVSAGTLQIGDGLNAGSLPGSAVVQGALVFNGSSYSAANNISGPGSLTSVGSGCSLTLAGVNTYTGPTTIRNGGTLTLGAASGLPAASVLVLGDTGAGSIGSADFTGYNVVCGGLTVGGNQTAANTITVGSGQSLTVNGNVNLGNLGTGGARANLTIFGSGASVTVNTNGGLIQLGLSTGGAGTIPNNVDCNLTGLDTFTANLGDAGLLSIGETNINTQNNPALVVLRLAATNSITAGTIAVGNGGKGSTRELHLGGGTNLLNLGLLRVGAADAFGRDSGKLLFESGTGSVRLRGSAGGTSRANLNILVGIAGSTAATTNSFDLTGHYADLLIDALVLGDVSNHIGAWDNYFGFDQGVLDANSVYLSKGCLNGTAATSLMHLGGGTVNFGSLVLAASTAAATLDISGGQVTVNNDITKPGTGVGTIQVANASLQAQGRIGSAGAPLDVLSLDTTTLSVGRRVGYGNPTAALVAASSVTFQGACTLALTGTNYVAGQFPLVSYSGVLGGAGFAALNLVAPPGVSASLVDNSANHSVDILITHAPPLGAPASLAFASAPGSLNLAWQDLGMILQTNAVSVADPAHWFTYPGSTTVTNLSLTIPPAGTNVFFRLLYP